MHKKILTTPRTDAAKIVDPAMPGHMLKYRQGRTPMVQAVHNRVKLKSKVIPWDAHREDRPAIVQPDDSTAIVHRNDAVLNPAAIVSRNDTPQLNRHCVRVAACVR